MLAQVQCAGQLKLIGPLAVTAPRLDPCKVAVKDTESALNICGIWWSVNLLVFSISFDQSEYNRHMVGKLS